MERRREGVGCVKENKRLEHIFEECEFTKGRKKVMEILNEKKADVKEMLRILEKRKKEIESEEVGERQPI